MTGGYGCIGTWIAKQLCEAGEEVWIYDLKEDTHRLDLVLDPEQKAAVHFRARRCLRCRCPARRPSAPCEATHILHLAGLQTPDLPGQPDPRCEGQRDRHPRGIRGGAGAQRPGAAGRLCKLGRGARPGRTGCPGRHRRPGPPGPAVALRCLQGVQRAECPRLLARSRDHQHRPAALDGLRRRARLRNDQRADQGHQVGRGGPAVSHQLWRQARPAIRGRRRRDVRAGARRSPSREPTRSTCGEPSSRSSDS